MKAMYAERYGDVPVSIEPIAGEGSGRKYYRLKGKHAMVVGTIGTSSDENNAFVRLSERFSQSGLPVPQILAMSSDGMAYLQSDAGDRSLYDLIRSDGRDSETVERLLHRVMRLLPRFHYIGSDTFDRSNFFGRGVMDRRSVLWDLNYFKYAFLKPSGIEFDEDRLEDDFDLLTTKIAATGKEKTMMLRDFQSRNVIISAEGEPTLIDFQGARIGDGLYDVASFVWQARAGFSADLRKNLVATYRSAAEELTGKIEDDFDERLSRMILLRLLQVLGAYGYRGLFERKSRFIESIPAALNSLRELLNVHPEVVPTYLRNVLERMAESPLFRSEGGDEGLTVKVISFSFKKGIPLDNSGNGGGFVFDCRGMHNPGRYDRYKSLTGRDRDVVDFLENRGEIQTFMEHCYALVDKTVECYLRRGFTRLMVCFGCTGGQHRSVYGAEHMALHLNQKYGVRVKLIHREQAIEQTFEQR